MSEQSITDVTPDTPTDETPAFDLDTWLSGMSSTERSVDIYGNTQVFGRYEHLARELEVAKAAEAAGETSIDDVSTVARIEAEMAALFEVQQRSKTTWYLQALDSATIKQIEQDHPVPDLPAKPEEPAKNAPAAVKGQYEAAVRKWEQETEAARESHNAAVNEQNLHYIAAAVVRIEDHQGRVITNKVTVEQVRALEAKPHGPMQTGRLLDAAFKAKAGEPVIPAPFSPSSSKPARN